MKKKFKLLLFGINGKIAREFISYIKNNKQINIDIVAGYDYKKNLEFTTYQKIELIPDIYDIILDYSSANAVYEIAKLTKRIKKPICIAATGHNEKEHKLIEKLSKEVAIFHSSNMSLGINIILNILKNSRKLFENKYDIEIIEKHHKFKKDSPSGTARMMYNAISENTNKYKKKDINIHSIRGGNIIGEHEILFIGQDEIITIKHEALSKKLFILGTIEAIKFVINKKNGLYNMDNIININ